MMEILAGLNSDSVLKITYEPVNLANVAKWDY